MGKLRFTLTNLIFWPILAGTIFLCTNLNFLRGESFPFFDIPSFSLLALLLVGLSIVYYILEAKKNDIKVHYIFFPAILMITILFVAVIWVQPVETFTGVYGEITVDPTNYKVPYTIEIILGMSGIYMLLFTYSKKQITPKSVRWVMVIYLLFTLVSLGYGVISDIENIKLLFIPSEDPSLTYKGLESFFYNENIYGGCLLSAILCCFMLNSYKHRWYWHIPMFILYGGIFLTTSATSIIISTISIVAYIVYELITLMRKRFALGLIMTILTVLIVLSVVLGTVFLIHYDVKWFVTAINFFFEDITNKDFSTFTNRTEIWKKVWDLLLKDNPIYIIFGRGNGIAYRYFHGMLGVEYYLHANYSEAVHSTHNGFVDILLRNGIFGLVLYVGAICYFIGCVIYLIVKKKASFAVSSLICVLTILLHSCFETDVFFDLNFFSMLYTIMFFLPVLNYASNVKKPRIAAKLIEEDHNSGQMDKRRLATFIASVILLLIVSVTLCFGASIIHSNEILRLILLGVLVLLSASYFFLPGIISNIYGGRNKARYITYLILYFAMFIVLFISASLGVDLLKKFDIITLPRYLILLGVTLIYFFTGFVLSMKLNKYKFDHYLKDIFVTVFKLNIIPISISAFVAFIFYVGIQFALPLDIYSHIAIFVIVPSVYIFTFFLQKQDIKSYYVYYFNEYSLSRITKQIK